MFVARQERLRKADSPVVLCRRPSISRTACAQQPSTSCSYLEASSQSTNSTLTWHTACNGVHEWSSWSREPCKSKGTRARAGTEPCSNYCASCSSWCCSVVGTAVWLHFVASAQQAQPRQQGRRTASRAGKQPWQAQRTDDDWHKHSQRQLPAGAASKSSTPLLHAR